MNIELLREEIDIINRDILNLLAKRCDISIEIAKYKIKMNLPILDQNREKFILDNISKQSKTLGMNPKIVRIIFKYIINLSKDVQKKLFLKT